MAADQSGGGGADRISDLPDHLLHTILLLVPGGTAADAARTSVLSHRWRRVWAGLPELALRYRLKTALYAGGAHERIDAALAAYDGSASSTLRRLEITMPYGSSHLTSERVSSWLRFAARRVAGDLLLSLPHRVPDGDDREELVVPPCERVTTMHIEHARRTLRFPAAPGSTAAFTALTALSPEDK